MTKSLWTPVAGAKSPRPGLRPEPASGRDPHPHPHSEKTAFGVDLSNFQGELTPVSLADLKAQHCSFVIVQAITGVDGRSFTRQQLRAGVDAGMEVQGYIWCFPGETRASLHARLHMFDGFAITRLWLDVEQPGVSQADVNLGLAECDAYFGGLSGVYTGKWFFDQQGWSDQPLWAHRPLWDAQYDGVPDVDANFRSYGGWRTREIKQYWSKPMDVNARRM